MASSIITIRSGIPPPGEEICNRAKSALTQEVITSKDRAKCPTFPSSSQPSPPAYANTPPPSTPSTSPSDKSSQIHLGDVSPLGPLAHGPTQVHASFLPDAGSLVSEPSYPLRLDAVFRHGSDFLRFDPGGARARLEVTSVLRDAATGAAVRFDYTGTVDVSGAAGKVLNAEPDAKTTEFGGICRCSPSSVSNVQR